MKKLSIPYGRRRHAAVVPSANALVVEGLTAGYPRAPRPAVREISVQIPPGSRVALIGPNGSGKSSLLKAIAGLLPLQEGIVRIYGNTIGACHHRVAYLPQRGEIDWNFPINVERLVLTGRYVHLGWLRRPSKRDYEIAHEVMARLDLTRLAQRQIGRLSGGQQQRALVARALAQGSDLFLLDEPLNAVDLATCEIIHEVLRELQSQGKTLVVATHDLARLERDYDMTVHLQDGRQIAGKSEPLTNSIQERGAAWNG